MGEVAALGAVAVDDDRLLPMTLVISYSIGRSIDGRTPASAARWTTASNVLSGNSPLADVADVERHALWQQVLWRDVVEAGDPVPCRLEVPDDMGADETGGTGDEDGQRFGIHASRCESTGSPFG